jgi:two-component system, chemotaxis family, protein-glutamate methylesterase/glutaminase
MRSSSASSGGSSRATADRPAPLRVMIVEDSATIRTMLCHLIDQDPRLRVVCAVESGEEALEAVARAQPDVITIDVRLPGINGLELTRHIMARRPTPIVVVASNVQGEELQISIAALRAGALSVLEKPCVSTPIDYATFGVRLCEQLVLMSSVRVITQRLPATVRGAVGRAAVEAEGVAARVRARIVGIAASTGGPKALAEILGALRRDFPLSVLLVQHITPSFCAGFAAWLGTVTELEVRMAEDDMTPVPGVVVVAAPERHLVARAQRLRLDDGAPVLGQRPSGTVLLASLAEEYGPEAIGVVLTGMGVDGAEGLLAMRRAGAYTIAEDRSTATVFGMPGAAVGLQAVRETLPAQRIALRLLQLAGEGR